MHNHEIQTIAIFSAQYKNIEDAENAGALYSVDIEYPMTLNDLSRLCDSIAEAVGGLAPIFPYTFYHLTHYWFAAADIPVANDTPVHYADAIRCNVRRPPQGSLPLLTRRVSA